jgi:hypothetical protein
MKFLKDYIFLKIYRFLLKARVLYGPFIDLFLRLFKLDILKFLAGVYTLKLKLNVSLKFLNNF